MVRLEVLDLVSVARTDGVTRGMRLEHSFAVVGALAVAGTDLRDLLLFTRAQPPTELAEGIVRAFPRLHTLQLGIDMYRPSRPAFTPVWVRIRSISPPPTRPRADPLTPRRSSLRCSRH